MSREDIQTLCNAALVSVEDLLPPALYQEADAWINQYDEWGLAIEFVIDEVGELGLPLAREQFEAIRAAMRSACNCKAPACPISNSRSSRWARSRASTLLSQLIFLPSMLIGGMMVPLDILPASVQRFSALLPTTHAMQALEGLAYDKATAFAPTTSILVLLTSGLLAFGLAIYLFNWDSRNQTRRGHPLLALIAFAPYLVSLAL